jgi:bifunctional non-homologous end joining protein LigD
MCPFAARPPTNERPHCVMPRLVAEVKFSEWTADGRLRAPVYLGLRDDVPPESVRGEPTPRRPIRSEAKRRATLQYRPRTPPPG